MAAARRSTRDWRDSRRSNSHAGSSRRAERGDDDPRSSSRRSSRESARGGPSKDTTIVIGGVVAAVLILGFGVLAFSTKKKVVRTTERAPAPAATPVSTRDWYSIGYGEGRDWASHVPRRGVMAGGDGDPFAPDKVLDMADRQTSNWYNKGLKNDAEGQKRYIRGFCDGVKVVSGR